MPINFSQKKDMPKNSVHELTSVKYRQSNHHANERLVERWLVSLFCLYPIVVLSLLCQIFICLRCSNCWNFCSFLLILQVKNNSSLDAQLSDICIGTTVAPTSLPPYFFQTKDSDGKVREFNLIDGGVAANNPVK